MKKRILCLLLCLMMIVSMGATSPAAAAEAPWMLSLS